MNQRKPFWNPYLAGFVLGLVLLGSDVLTGRGLGASGTFKHLAGAIIHALSPTYAEENINTAGFFADPTRSSLDDWIVWVTVGSLIGGAIAVFTGGRFKVETIMGPRASKEGRWVLAGVGGILAGLGAQFAKGCTSGQGLTGGAQLAVGSWVFLLSVFVGAYGLAWFLRKQWV